MTNALDLEPPLSNVLSRLTEADLDIYEGICQDIDDCRDPYWITEAIAKAIALIESRPVVLALCHHAHQEREDLRWECVGRHAANRLRDLFGLPLTRLTNP
jgi:hypothetical protein